MDGRGEMGQGHLKAELLSDCLTEPEQIGFLLVCQKWDESDHLGAGKAPFLIGVCATLTLVLISLVGDCRDLDGIPRHTRVL